MTYRTPDQIQEEKDEHARQEQAGRERTAAMSPEEREKAIAVIMKRGVVHRYETGLLPGPIPSGYYNWGDPDDPCPIPRVSVNKIRSVMEIPEDYVGCVAVCGFGEVYLWRGYTDYKYIMSTYLLSPCVNPVIYNPRTRCGTVSGLRVNLPLRTEATEKWNENVSLEERGRVMDWRNAAIAVQADLDAQEEARRPRVFVKTQERTAVIAGQSRPNDPERAREEADAIEIAAHIQTLRGEEREWMPQGFYQIALAKVQERNTRKYSRENVLRWVEILRAWGLAFVGEEKSVNNKTKILLRFPPHFYDVEFFPSRRKDSPACWEGPMYAPIPDRVIEIIR